jgi:TPR repeat protein
MNELGIYFLTPDTDHFIPGRGLRYLEASAARQDIYGYHNLGFVSLVGLVDEEPDYQTAYDWFVKAAEGGHPRSPTTIGRMIVRDQVDGTAAEAVRWYDMGLERGDPWGGVNAATMILNGDVSGFTPSEALVRAAKAQFLAGDEPAERARSLLDDAGEGDLSRAVQLLLNELGAQVIVDGAIGPATRAAMQEIVSATDFAMPGGGVRPKLDLLARIWWSQNPVRSDIF